MEDLNNWDLAVLEEEWREEALERKEWEESKHKTFKCFGRIYTYDTLPVILGRFSRPSEYEEYLEEKEQLHYEQYGLGLQYKAHYRTDIATSSDNLSVQSALSQIEVIDCVILKNGAHYRVYSGYSAAEKALGLTKGKIQKAKFGTIFNEDWELVKSIT